ncbi:MAG: hypothetical protein JAY67_05480 [Candidatus Thiodiazotropha taylori]|nr:hypothetical protein [Candidatus Thiodiazotropha taylori]MCG7972350.1 hypothetical protein [Candidatus Thiodiazotropha taylori]MCG7972363.1 hypothetical protein [Candidatus Thiodiazotropha taylori]
MNGVQPEPNNQLRGLAHIGLLLLALAYPLVLHFGVLSGGLIAPSLILMLLLANWGVLELIKGRLSGWLIIAIALLGIAWLLLETPDTIQLLKLPPIAINGSLFTLFTMTLLPGQTPLITRFAELLHKDERELNDYERLYTRRVTQFWSGMFAFLTVESAYLAYFADTETWSLFTNFVNYLIVIAGLLIEYRIRERKLPHLEHPGFWNFVRLVRRIEWRSLL